MIPNWRHSPCSQYKEYINLIRPKILLVHLFQLFKTEVRVVLSDWLLSGGLFGNYAAKLRGAVAWYLADELVGRVGYNQGIFRNIDQDNCLIIQHIDNKAQFCCRRLEVGDDLCHFSPRHAKLPISQDVCYLRTTSIRCTTITIGQSCNVLNNVHVLRAEKVARNTISVNNLLNIRVLYLWKLS